MGLDPADILEATIGDSDPRGTGLSDAPLGLFPKAGQSFTILSTGLAVSADDPDDNNGELLSVPDPVDDKTFVLDGLNNNQGNDLVQFSLILQPPPGKTSLSFDFAFYSEEFPDYIDSEFNDVFVAELGAEPFNSQLSIDSQNQASAPNNIAFDPNGDLISINAAFGFDPAHPNPATGTTYDGTSGLLRATGCLPEERPTGNVVLILSITDIGDELLDTAVFLDNFQWGEPDTCQAGATQLTLDVLPETATLPVGDFHTVIAGVIDDEGNAVEGQQLGVTVTGANPTGGLVTTDAGGQALFTYAGTNAGSDVITVWIDENLNGLPDETELAEVVTAEWEVPVVPGTITITKAVKGDPGGAGFGFEGDLGEFSLAAGESQTFADIPPDDYTIVETEAPELWALMSVVCNDEVVTVEKIAQPAGRGVVISLGSGQSLTCIFTNERANFSEPITVYLPVVVKGS
ncbi:MAG: choice-of-anchor L domain-containing protein, partial [Anaerolineae bacterium]|nr:choice-of-anchor L domain-containing protein [Anaerolineae bacterium]